MRQPTDEELEAYGRPIYAIMMMSKSGADSIIYDSGKDSGFPDTGSTDYPGFYYELETAIEAMHANAGDIRETCYDYGFVLRHWPGLYNNAAGKDDRIYFVWDKERGGFYEAEEPKLLQHLAF